METFDNKLDKLMELPFYAGMSAEQQEKTKNYLRENQEKNKVKQVKQLAIAKFNSWESIVLPINTIENSAFKLVTENKLDGIVLIGRRPGEREYLSIPDYVGDLNAMHEAEQFLTLTQQGLYLTNLKKWITTPEFATAQERADVYIETFGLL